MRARATVVLVILAGGALAAAPRIPPPDWLLPRFVGSAAIPPPASTSHYMQTADPDVAYDMGCEMGRGADAGTQPQQAVVVLAFGMPVAFGGGTYGASLFSGPDRRTTEIRVAVQEMAHGFWACTLGLGPKLTIAIGTSNYGPDVSHAHGYAWGRMVDRANEILRQKGWSLQVAVAGASDIELSWSNPKVARRWLEGYADATNDPLINFGDAAGCPPAGSSCGTSAHPEWEQSDVWDLAWGHPPAVPLPEVYRNDGIMAEQWHQIANIGVRHRSSLMQFTGSMTQYAACREAGCDASTDNTPSQGWRQLYDALNSGDGTDQTPQFATDISWSTNVAGSPSFPARSALIPADAGWPAGIIGDGEFPSSRYAFVDRWTGVLRGEHVTVYAGSYADDPRQGVLLVMTVSMDLRRAQGGEYPTGDGRGPVRILSRHGWELELRSEDGTVDSFDLRSGGFARP